MARAAIIRSWQARPDWWAVGIGAAAVLLLWSIGAGKELWFDERFVEMVARRPVGEMFSLLRFENNPPWIFLLTHGWTNVFGSDPILLRFLTLVPSLLSLLVIRRLAADLFGRVTAAIVVVLLAVAGQVVIQSLELRMYPWVMLWSGLAIWLTWRFAQTGRTSQLVWLGSVHLLGLYTHYTYGFVLIATSIWLLIRSKRRRAVLSSLVISGLLFLPWFIISIWPKLTDLSSNVGIQRIAATRLEALRLPIDFIVPTPLQSDGGWLMVRMVAGVIIIFGIFFFCRRWRQRDNQLAIRYLIIVTSLAAAGLVITGIVVPKYASILVIPVVLIVGHGLRQVPLLASARFGVVVALVILATTVALEHVRQPNVTYAQAARVITAAEQPGDVILIYPFNDTIAFGPSYHGTLPVRGFFPLKDPAETSVTDIVRYNFRVTLNSDNINRLESYVGGATRVWFLFDVPPSPGYWHGDLIAEWFRAHGYEATVYSEIFKNVPPLLIRYDKLGV